MPLGRHGRITAFTLDEETHDVAVVASSPLEGGLRYRCFARGRFGMGIFILRC
jgi:hypothetical protein